MWSFDQIMSVLFKKHPDALKKYPIHILFIVIIHIIIICCHSNIISIIVNSFHSSINKCDISLNVVQLVIQGGQKVHFQFTIIIPVI